MAETTYEKVRLIRMNHCYYLLECVGRKSESIATQLVGLVLQTLLLPMRLLLVIGDSPTRRFGPKIEGADVQHNPTPGPADRPFLRRALKTGVTIAGRFCKDATLHDLPPKREKRSRGRPRKYGDSSWDDLDRRPSYANRRQALRGQIFRNELSTITAAWLLPRKIVQLAKSLVALAA